MKRILPLIGIFCFCSVASTFGQFEHKVTATVFTGVPFFKKAGGIQGENIFNGYASIPYLGFGLNYNLNTHFSIGANVKEFVTKKANYSLSNSNLGIGVKYNIVPMDKKISPFVAAEGDVGFMVLGQKANSTWEYPEASNDQQVTYVAQLHNYPKVNTTATYVGAILGAGVDFTLKLKYGVFISANYMFTNAQSTSAIVMDFKDNTSKFDFFMIQTGLRFSFGKSKSLY